MQTPDYSHVTNVTEEEDFHDEVNITRERLNGFSLMEAMERTGLVQVDDEVADTPWEV